MILSLLLSSSAFADFSSEHESLCGKTEKCQLILAPKEVTQISHTCVGKLADMNCRVMMLKTSDSASMNFLCGDAESPLLNQVLNAEVLSYNVASVSGTSVTNDSADYHLFSSPALNVLISSSGNVSAKMILTLQERSLTLTDVVCE